MLAGEPWEGQAEGHESGKHGNGSTASSMGSLNASHASPEAFENASAKSRVGQLAAYANAVNQGKLSAAAQALAKASNKALTTESVQAVNANLSISMSNQTAANIASMANADRSSK